MSAAHDRRRRTWLAVLLLLGCTVFAVRTLFGSGGGADPAEPSAVDFVDGDEAETSEATAGLDFDLLAEHGSFQRSTPVRLAFVVPVEPLPASPLAEPAPRATVRGGAAVWVGDDPPRLRVGVVLVTDGCRRALLGDRIVGVGEPLGELRVTAIERGCVVVRWRGRDLDDDLDDDAPQEFRPELRRRSERAAASGEIDAPAPEGDR